MLHRLSSLRTSAWPSAGLAFAGIAPIIILMWAWLGAPVAMPPSPLAQGVKLDCMSYTPYQSADSPFSQSTAPIAPSLIAADVARLAPLTSCLRTYSAADHGIGEVVPAAARQGLSVMQGIWISRDPIANTKELEAAVALAKSHPNTVTALIVGNEVLLRNEQTAAALVELIKTAKAQSGIPVTYADVWEFWLKNPSVAESVDFVTIHILPFWEDVPVSAEAAAQHVGEIYGRVTAAFPNKRIIIGEVGWPSTGRMRDVARPSPVNQARVIHDVIALTREKGITANIIEAFDQPWKRVLEGAVGGYWGIFDATNRQPKFPFGQPLSDHPQWRLQAAAGVGLAALVLGLCVLVASRRPAARPQLTAQDWGRIAIVTLTGCGLAGLAAETLPVGAFGVAGIVRSIALGTLSLIAPFVAVAIAAGASLPSLSQVIGPSDLRVRCPLSLMLGLVLIASLLSATEVALSLVFQPRYMEFPIASITAIAVAIAALVWTQSPAHSGAANPPRLAEKTGALVLAVCAVFIAYNEGPKNWQALALTAALVLLAAALWQHRGAPTQAP